MQSLEAETAVSGTVTAYLVRSETEWGLSNNPGFAYLNSFNASKKYCLPISRGHIHT